MNSIIRMVALGIGVLYLSGCGSQPSSQSLSTSHNSTESQAPTPQISPAGGTFSFTAPVSVMITDSTPGVLIYYTVDGGAPTTQSKLYTGPITVSNSETVKAVAVATGYSTSEVGSAVFTSLLPDISGKWEFQNGMNVNITQISEEQTVLGGTSAVYTAPAPGYGPVHSCGIGGAQSLTGTFNGTSVTLQANNCDNSVADNQQTTTTATIDRSASTMAGGQWGTGVKVSTLSGMYSGVLSYTDAAGVARTAQVGVVLNEDVTHQISATSVAISAGTFQQFSLNPGAAVGGTISLNGEATIQGQIRQGAQGIDGIDVWIDCPNMLLQGTLKPAVKLTVT